MPFSMKEWPLLATHLLCLFLGVALRNMAYKPSVSRTLSPSKILLPLKTRQIYLMRPSEVYDTQKMMLLKSQKKQRKPDCLYSDKVARMRVHGSFLFVELSKTSLKDYQGLISRSAGEFLLIPYERALSYEICPSKAEVTYGAP